MNRTALYGFALAHETNFLHTGHIFMKRASMSLSDSGEVDRASLPKYGFKEIQ